ncbi:hypothetical protein CHUAL_000934 [Chamberlinius hualienensis]
MADSSLDNFFAKKDKNKKSKSRKFMSADPAVKQFDDGGTSKSEKGKREKEKAPNSMSSSTLSQNTAQADDEWKDVEEKTTDYTGLKIQNVQISDLRDDENEKAKLDDAQDDENSKNKDALGPWKVVETAVAPSEPVVDEPVPAPAPKSNKYVAPAMRDQGASSLTTLPKAKPKTAPQLASDVDFPTLSAASDAKPKKIETSEQTRGKLSSHSSDQSSLRRPYSEMTNPANSS